MHNPSPDDLTRYHLLASAVAGRSMGLAPLAEEEAAYTDGRTIFLSGTGDHRTSVATITVQGALLAAGSLAPEIVKRLVGRPSVARRYLSVEGRRALAELAAVLPGVPLATEIRRDEPGSTSPEDSLQWALGRGAIADPPPEFGTLRPRRLLATITKDEGSAPTAQDLTKPLSEDALPELDEDEETQDLGTIAKLFSSPLGGKGPIAKMLNKLLGLGREPGSGPAGAELPVGGARAVTKPGANAQIGMTPAALAPVELPPEQGGGHLYPEWDVHKKKYRPKWCTVLEVDPRAEDLRGLDPVSGNDLRRRLARLGVGLERRRRQPQGDDIDIDAAVEARVELLAGSAPDEGLYIESQRRKRSLAVLVLLDISGSSGERTSAITVHERQRDAAAALLDALYVLGDRVALYGFHSQGRSAVHLVRVKSFEDPLNGLAMERLGGLTPGAYTRLGAAIRHGAHLLDTEAGTDRRLLLVLSDGFAYDYGYEGPYGESDARRALSEARRAGIGCLCLSLGTTTDPEALKRVFGTAAHASSDTLEELAPQMGRLFRRALISADLQRRLNQRRQRSTAA